MRPLATELNEEIKLNDFDAIEDRICIRTK